MRRIVSDPYLVAARSLLIIVHDLRWSALNNPFPCLDKRLERFSPNRSITRKVGNWLRAGTAYPSVGGGLPSASRRGRAGGGRALLEHSPDLIVSDVATAFLVDFELLSLMRSDADTDAISVILLSDRSDGDAMAKAEELGSADFLIKPVTLEDLMTSVHACLAKCKG